MKALRSFAGIAAPRESAPSIVEFDDTLVRLGVFERGRFSTYWDALRSFTARPSMPGRC
jgi:hypothetical protein